MRQCWRLKPCPLARSHVPFFRTCCRRSTIINDAVMQGKLLVVPTIYDLNTGQVQILNEEMARKAR